MAKRFRWRLDSVKKAKENEEERNQEALAGARNALRGEEGKLAELDDRREQAVRQIQEKQDGPLDPRDMVRRDAYVRDLEEQIKQQTGAVEAARSEADAKQEQLLKSMKERKVLDNLRERDRGRFKKAERRKEQAATDETANRQSHDRKNREE